MVRGIEGAMRWRVISAYSGDAFSAAFARRFGGISTVFDEVSYVNADYLRHFF